MAFPSRYTVKELPAPERPPHTPAGGITLRSESTESLVYASCDYESLPLWEIRAELDDGTTLELAERYLPELNLDQGPARLVHARASLDPLGPENVQRETSDYWNLVCARSRNLSLQASAEARVTVTS